VISTRTRRSSFERSSRWKPVGGDLRSPTDRNRELLRGRSPVSAGEGDAEGLGDGRRADWSADHSRRGVQSQSLGEYPSREGPGVGRGSPRSLESLGVVGLADRRRRERRGGDLRSVGDILATSHPAFFA
jgi:hypothetical protein